MADFNQIKDYAEERTIYNFFTSGSFLKKGLYVLIPIGLIFCLFMAMFAQEDRKELALTWDKVKPGDNLYAENLFVSDSSFRQFHTFRMIRPLNGSDISEMKIPKWEKLKLLAQIDTTAERKRPVMISYKIIFLQDDMFRHETALIGTYLKRDSITGMLDETIYIPLKWYAFKPNLKLCDTNFKYEMPKNYTFADSNIYVKPNLVRLEEPPIFKSKK